MLCALIITNSRNLSFTDINGESILRISIERILPIIPIERIFICTTAKNINLIKEELPNIKRKNIIVEPEERNTSSSVALSTLVINRYYKNSNIVVLPCDTLIKDEDTFRTLIRRYDGVLNIIGDGMLTFGIPPKAGVFDYSYINAKYIKNIVNSNIFYKVDRVIVNPPQNKARKYIESGNYLWSCGIFMGRGKTILNNIRRFLPSTYEVLKNLETCQVEDIERIVYNNYIRTDKVSIEVGVLEKSKELYVVPIDVGMERVSDLELMEKYKIDQVV